MKLLKTIVLLLIGVLFALVLLQSCYSVRIRSVEGAPEPEAPLVREDYYRGMTVIELDTVITISATSKDFTYLIKKSDLCPSGMLHTIEYKNTLGSVLLSAVTLGRKRKVKIKYVCMKENPN